MGLGRFTLDGSDAYDKYGIFVANDGYAALLSYPPLKAIDENIWPESNGSDPDLMSPYLDSQSFSIPFYAKKVESIRDFLRDITDGAYHTFVFTELGGLTMSLRLVQQDSQNLFPHIGAFALTFACDRPFIEDYEYQSPDPLTFNIPPQSGYKIDGKNLSDYGIYVLDGQDIKKLSAVKQNLLINNSVGNGATYDGKDVLFAKKELTLKCWGRYSTPNAMIIALNAFVHDLLQTTEKTDTDGTVYSDAIHEVQVKDNGSIYPCYYGGLTVTRFQMIQGKEERLTGDENLLVAEDGTTYIVSEDGEYYINLETSVKSGKAWVEFDLKIGLTDDNTLLVAEDGTTFVVSEDGLNFIDLNK